MVEKVTIVFMVLAILFPVMGAAFSALHRRQMRRIRKENLELLEEGTDLRKALMRIQALAEASGRPANEVARDIATLARAAHGEPRPPGEVRYFRLANR